MQKFHLKSCLRNQRKSSCIAANKAISITFIKHIVCPCPMSIIDHQPTNKSKMKIILFCMVYGIGQLYHVRFYLRGIILHAHLNSISYGRSECLMSIKLNTTFNFSTNFKKLERKVQDNLVFPNQSDFSLFAALMLL